MEKDRSTIIVGILIFYCYNISSLKQSLIISIYVHQKSDMSELDPLLKFHKSEIMMSTKAVFLSRASYAWDSLPSSLVVGRIQFLAVVAETVSGHSQ